MSFDVGEIIGKKVFWYFFVYVFGEVVERWFGCYFCNGLFIEDFLGFYYDMVNMEG